jgi:hypothetical protein
MFSSKRRRVFVALLAPAAALAIGAAVVLPTARVDAAQAPVGLGAATSYAVLAGAGITNTGATTINGDVGTFPTPSETGFGTVTLNGADNAGNAVTQQAKTDLVTGYNTAAGALPENAVPTELGGRTLTPGVYTSGTLGITGTLTLNTLGDPRAVFIFKASSTLITASASRIIVLNGAQACNVFWQVGSSATLGTGSSLIGTVMALQAITANTGATIQGRLLARNASVTLQNNTITRNVCAATTPTTAPRAATTSPTSGTVVVAPTTVPSGTPGATPGVTPVTGTPGSPGSPAAPGTPGSPGFPIPPLPRTM